MSVRSKMRSANLQSFNRGAKKLKAKAKALPKPVQIVAPITKLAPAAA